MVYSSRFIDFENMKFSNAKNVEEIKERVKKNPKFVSAYCDENEVFLVTGKDHVYHLNFDKMTVAATNISPDDAELFPYHNRVKIFSDFLVYDNAVMVTHSNMISVCDLNAKIIKNQKSWRHLNQIDQSKLN